MQKRKLQTISGNEDCTVFVDYEKKIKTQKNVKVVFLKM